MVPPVSLPVASAAPNGAAPAAGAQGSAAPATTETSQDFLLMLGQLLGASAPTPASAAQVAIGPVTTDSDTDTTDLLDSAALEAMLPFSLATPNMAPTMLPGAGAGAADGAEIGALMPSGGSGPDRAMLESLLSSLTARMGETQEGEQGDAAMFANLNGSTAVPLDEAAKARAALSSDPGRGLHTPVGSSEWADELSTRLTLMAERGHHTASLRLSPEHLGPLEIRISVTDDQASVWFGAAHADTRAAIEQALPRLRELFASQGLTLADAGVSHQAPQDQSRPQPTPGDASPNSDGEAKVISIAHRRLGLIDAYA
jgi:flagellar hook-length control protein FliK